MMEPNAAGGPEGMPDPSALAKMLGQLEPGAGMASPEDQAQFQDQLKDMEKVFGDMMGQIDDETKKVNAAAQEKKEIKVTKPAAAEKKEPAKMPEAPKKTEEKKPSEIPVNMNNEFGNFDQMFKTFEEISK